MISEFPDPPGGGSAARAAGLRQGGQGRGFHHATNCSSRPQAMPQRDRGRPVIAVERLVAGLTKGRCGVQSTMCRAPTRRTACTPAWTRRAM